MFERVVNLYRLLGKPEFDQAYCFDVLVEKSDDLIAALEECKEINGSLGNFSFVEKEGQLRVDAELPQHGAGHFFSTFNDFVERTPGLNKGCFRQDFYIRDIDFLSTESAEKHLVICNIKKIVEFVKALRDFSSITLDDDQTLESGKLIFLKAADGRSAQQAAVLRINVSTRLSAIEVRRFKILSEIKVARDKGRPHIEERVLIMNTAIAEIISECDDGDEDFEYLVKNWDRVVKKYFHDLHAYMNGFSFDAIRKKISDSVMESSTKINNALGEVGTKILAVPISLAALVVLSESKASTGFLIGVFGVVATSRVMSRTVSHYGDQLRNLMKSFEFNLEATSLAKKSFSSVIKKELDRINDFVVSQKEKINKTIGFYRALSFVPIVISLYMVVDRFFPEIQSAYSMAMYCGDALFEYVKVYKYFG